MPDPPVVHPLNDHCDDSIKRGHIKRQLEGEQFRDIAESIHKIIEGVAHCEKRLNGVEKKDGVNCVRSRVCFFFFEKMYLGVVPMILNTVLSPREYMR